LQVATEGAVTGKQPSRLNLIARAKWDAWSKVSNLTKEQAMQRYVEEVAKADSNWKSIKSKL